MPPLYEECNCRSSIKMIKKPHMVLKEKMPMPNGLMVEAWDRSVSIAAGTVKVALLIRIRVDIQPAYFVKPEHYELVRKIMGTEIFFEYKEERTFVRERKKMPFLKNCWTLSRKTPCHIFPGPHFLRGSLSPNTGILKETATNTVPSSEISRS